MAKQHSLPRFDADIYENFIDICNDILKSEGVKAEFEVTASGKIRLKQSKISPEKFAKARDSIRIGG